MSPQLSHRRSRAVTLLVLGLTALLLVTATPAAAEQVVQPGPPKGDPGAVGTPGTPGTFDCMGGPDLYYNGKIFYKDHVYCGENWSHMGFRPNGKPEEVTGPGTPPIKDLTRYNCLKYWDVWRFYGDESNPTRVVSHARNEPVAPCMDEWMQQFVFFSPHPNDAGRSPGVPFGTRTKQYDDRYVTYHDTGPSSSNACPIPDDNANLARFFKESYADEAEAAVAEAFRQGMLGGFQRYHKAFLNSGLFGDYAQIWFNTAGKGSPGIGRYPDGIPCSAGLDAAVADEDGDGKPDQPGYIWGVCYAPVFARYQPYSRDGVKIHQQVLPDGDWYGIDYMKKTLLPQSQDKRPAAKKEDKEVIAKYRTAIQMSSGVANGSEAKGIVNCYLGRSEIVSIEATAPKDIKVDTPTISVSAADAYIGGTRHEFTWTVPVPAITCNGGQDCEGTAYIKSVSYAPQLIGPSGWTACPGTTTKLNTARSNQATCDFWLNLSQRNNGALDVKARFYTATNRDETFTIDYGQKVVVHVEPATEETFMQVCLGHQWAGVNVSGTNGCVNIAGGRTGYDVEFDEVFGASTSIAVNGTRSTGAYR